MTSSEGGSENYGALPSSYRRRVRKSKSVATIQSNNLRLRLQRSVPFLRHRSTTTLQRSPEPSWERHEEVVQLARAQYFNGSGPSETQGIQRDKQDTFHRREPRTFKTSVRASENIVAGIQPAVKRSSSLATLRDRVRKVIERTLNRKQSLPPQQIEAQRNYFSDLSPDLGLASGFDSYQFNEENAPQNHTYLPLPQDELLEDLDKCPYNMTSSTSRESLHSNARSRVTSWTDSSATGSVALRSGPIERNRLSIIKEDGGPHQPSSSAGKHFGGVDLLHGPLQSVTNSALGLPTIDSQRIYSALIKRIDEEEAEVERTRLAVESLQREGSHQASSGTTMTIRAVYSNSPSLTVATDCPGRQLNSRSGSCEAGLVTTGTDDVPHKDSSIKRRERHAEQEQQSAFFPFSSEQSPNTPSPFKRFLNQRRSRARSRSRSRSSDRGCKPEADGGNTVINCQLSNQVMSRPRFGLSSASIYSRTTNGGSNEQYQHQVDSSEELFSIGPIGLEPTGMATVLPPTILPSAQDQWNPWSSSIDQQHYSSSSNLHMRERARISSEEEGDVMPSSDTTRRHHPDVIQDKLVPETSRVRTVVGVDQARQGLTKQKSVDALSNISNKADDGSKGSENLRKFSPSNLAKFLTDRKGQRQARPQSARKENNPGDPEGSPPISTPGRLQLQFRNGSSTGRLRQKASETAFQARNGVYSTPHHSISTTPSRSHESPSETAKHQLVARLSRPFNMDVPPPNRPFDSMYLGKRMLGHPDALGDNRLSVAHHETKESLAQTNERDTTALPSRSASAGKSATRMFGIRGSKRMVSNFLKSRRSGKSTSASEHNPEEGSPAFL